MRKSIIAVLSMAVLLGGCAETTNIFEPDARQFEEPVTEEVVTEEAVTEEADYNTEPSEEKEAEEEDEAEAVEEPGEVSEAEAEPVEETESVFSNETDV
ncbi:MAG: hypothetical protein IJV16_02105, partial [Lachnospiraceae bacterium]|nr:hypothetical protein [Lachnospiraceae bacterium]